MGKEICHKLYFGNLPAQTTESKLREFLNHNGLVSTITLRRGYAFVECTDQATADIIIDLYQGRTFMGNLIVVEPAFRGPRREIHIYSPRILVSNCSATTTEEEVETMVSGHGGTVAFIEKGDPGTFIVTLSEDQQVEDIVQACKDVTLNDVAVKVEAAPTSEARKDSSTSFKNPRSSSRPQNLAYVHRPSDFPLRILVPGEYVSALIGKGGSTIREITQTTGARVDVYRHKTSRHFAVEKVVAIIGSPENCSAACKKILELLAKEASTLECQSDSPPTEICLKVLSDNNWIGRIIGRQGANIKKVMEETQTKIHISNQNEYNRAYMTSGVESSDRIITIRGSIEGMCNAESLISAKMKTAFEADCQIGQAFGSGDASNVLHSSTSSTRNLDHLLLMTDQLTPSYFSALPVRQAMFKNTVASPFGSLAVNMVNHATLRTPNCFGASDSGLDRTYLYIPKHFVGKILGANGSTIRGMIRESGASLKIEKSVSDDPDETERRITISGPLECHWRAQYLLFHKLTEDGRLRPDLKLTLELTVPSNIVGRLIGRGGVRIKGLQTQTGASIKFLNDETDGENTFAQLYGNFDELYAAQVKIHQVVKSIQKRRLMGYEGQSDDAPSY